MGSASLTQPARVAPPPAARRLAVALGLGLLAGLAVASKALHAALPAAPLPLLALLLSMTVGALLAARPMRRALQPPLEIPLSIGMILLGVQFEAGLLQRFSLGELGALLAHWSVVGALFALAAARGWLGPRTAGLFGVGLTGCGISAVVAAADGDRGVQPALRASAVAVILCTGALGFTLLPVAARLLELDATQLALWAGFAMPTTAEAVLIGSEHSTEAMQLVGAVRFFVNVLQWIPILVYLQLLTRATEPGGRALARTLTSTVRRIPAFVWGLALFGAFGFFGAFPPSERAVVANLTNWSFLMALVGIGLVTRPGVLASSWRSAALAALLWSVAAATSLVFIRGVL